MTTGTILCNTPLVADATVQLHSAATATEHNRQQSLSIVANNADNFGGRGSEAFQSAIAMVNSQYDQQQQAITQAGQALGVANDGFTQTDGACASQYA
jgi:uncharacterized protein YukE